MAAQTEGDSLLEVFIFETLQNTEQLEKIIIDAEKDDGFSDSAINEIFRIMHTIKGSAAMMAYSHISSLAHNAEDLFYFIRENPETKYDCYKISDLILMCMDYINNEIANIKENKEADTEESEKLIKAIDKYLCKLKINDDETEMKEADTQKPAQNCFKAVLSFDEGCEMENIRAYSIIRDMSEYAYNTTYTPENIIDNDDTSLIIRKEGFTVIFESDKSYEELYDKFVKTPFIKDTDLTLLDTERYGKAESDIKNSDKKANVEEKKNISLKDEQKEAIAEEKGKDEIQGKVDSHQSVQSIISINVSKLDKLMNLVGEVVTAELMVVGNPDLKGLELPSFQKEASQLHKIIVEMQDMVMSMRLVPLTTTFQRTHRIARDMSKKLGKEVNLEFIGEETEVDKNIIEHLSDPLMHLVRNCIDHGLESKEERIAANKSPIGKVTLEAYNAGSNVYILVKDDGKGINKEKVLEKAKRSNLLVKPEKDMTDREIYNLIFLPGFSTNDAVSEYSGRGVGMDVVMQNILSIGGSVSVESAEGKGTTTIMKIPLTVAIIDGMKIDVANNHFIIPITAIRESFKPSEENIIHDTDGNEMIMVRGECFAIMRLHRQYNINTKVTDLKDGILIMIDQEDKRRCIFADNILGQQQVVVKAMPDYVKQMKMAEGVSGCSLLGDGGISLILDASWLVNSEIKNCKKGGEFYGGTGEQLC